MILSVPRSLLLLLSYPIEFVSGLMGIQQPISPVRVRKLFRSTNVEPERLQQLGYQWKFDLPAALRDWRQDSPRDFES
jgi:hypothetical protein